MSVVVEKTVTVPVSLTEAFKKIEAFFRQKLETTMEERNLSPEEGYFKVNFKKSIISNGEVLTIRLKPQEEGIEVQMVSASTVEKTKYDWGKNDRNIRLVLELLGVVKKRETKGVYYPGQR